MAFECMEQMCRGVLPVARNELSESAVSVLALSRSRVLNIIRACRIGKKSFWRTMRRAAPRAAATDLLRGSFC